MCYSLLVLVRLEPNPHRFSGFSSWPHLPWQAKRIVLVGLTAAGQAWSDGYVHAVWPVADPCERDTCETIDVS